MIPMLIFWSYPFFPSLQSETVVEWRHFSNSLNQLDTTKCTTCNWSKAKPSLILLVDCKPAESLSHIISLAGEVTRFEWERKAEVLLIQLQCKYMWKLPFWKKPTDEHFHHGTSLSDQMYQFRDWSHEVWGWIPLHRQRWNSLLEALDEEVCADHDGNSVELGRSWKAHSMLKLRALASSGVTSSRWLTRCSRRRQESSAGGGPRLSFPSSAQLVARQSCLSPFF